MSPPQEMFAAVLHAPGDLRFERWPVPSDPFPDEALVKVMAAGICGSDIGRVMVSGTYRFPTIPGHEFSGVVEAVGSAVSSVKPGQRVAVAPLMPCFACPSCQRGQYSLCDDYSFLGSRANGGFAQYVKAPARNLVPFPDNIGFEEAATIESAAIVMHGLRKVGLHPGDAVAVIGVGALGFFAVRLAKLSGATPLVAVDIDPSKLEVARQAGADLCLDPRTEDVSRRIRELTQGRGADLVLETAGNNPGRELAISCVCKQGTIVAYGSAHQDVVFKPEQFERILRHEIRLVGSWNSYSVPFPGREWHALIQLIEAGALRPAPLISHVMPLSEAPQVFKDIAERSFGGYSKVIFLPHPDAVSYASVVEHAPPRGDAYAQEVRDGLR